MADKRVKYRDPEKMRLWREQLYAQVPTGGMSIGQAIKQMRKISGLTQVEFARHRNVSLPALQQIERDQGNPTVETLNRLAAIFGLKAGFVPASPVATPTAVPTASPGPAPKAKRST